MAVSDFKYATQRDLKDIIPNIDSYDSKEIIRDFNNITGSVWIAHNTGLITNLFSNGEKLEVAVSGTSGNSLTTTNQALLDNIIDNDTINYNTLAVSDASGLQLGDFIKLQYVSGDITVVEQVQIEAIDTNTLTIKRGMLGTTPKSIINGANVHLTVRVTENNQWYYDAYSDQLILFSPASRNPNDDVLIETGEDYKTYVNRMLVNGAKELSSLLDAKFPRPIPPAHLDIASDPEYDYCIIRANALLTASYMIQTKDLEYAEQLYNQVTNTEKTGIVDRLNDGHIKLAFEVDKTDSSGDIVEIVNTGSMKLVETWGEWRGERFDRVKLTCTTQGAYGVAICSVKKFGNDQLYGETLDTLTVSGGMDEICNGLYARFSGNTMNVGDEFDIVVRNHNIAETNTNAYSVGLYR
tara:strand:+ start:6299 stop:7528 length:1230 start_codon:yes stop_codon:yes gene_type:complete